MSGPMQITYANISNLGTDVTQVVNKVTQARTDLNKDVQNLMTNGWSGTAQETYDSQVHKPLDAKLAETLGVLGRLGVVLPQIADDYKATEDAVVKGMP